MDFEDLNQKVDVSYFTSLVRATWVAALLVHHGVSCEVSLMISCRDMNKYVLHFHQDQNVS